MKIPKTVSICGQKFKVVYKDNLVQGDVDLLGMCDVNKCTIFLKKGMVGEKQAEVFIHECIHAIDENLDMKLGERRVNTLCLEILRLIKNNKLNLNE